MNKKDRIAVVLSVPVLIFLVLFLFSGGEGVLIALVLGTPLFIYWGYRFIKGDISFIDSIIQKKD